MTSLVPALLVPPRSDRVPVSGVGARSANRSWPILDAAALHGLAGEVVNTIDPETEADPAGVLMTFLVTAGAAFGPGPHAWAEVAHPARLNVVLVGETSKGRKGSSWENPKRVIEKADPDFVRHRVLGGFGSGEAIADEFKEADRRLLVRESEYARLLNVANRDGSNLSPIIRDAWDGNRIEARSRGAGKVVVDDAHVCVLGHITADELRGKLTAIEVANGFANRFLYVLVKRSKLLPKGGNLDERAVEDLGEKLRRCLDPGRATVRMNRSHDAEKRWEQLYREMAEDCPPGLLGAVVARAEPQVLRLSVLYALLDQSRRVELSHLEAAWAVWGYCRASAAWLFGDSTGYPLADRVTGLLEAAEHKMLSRTELRAGLQHHVPRSQIDHAIDYLEARGRVLVVSVPTDGRPREMVMLR